MVQGHQYETVSSFICEAFGYIPRTGESIKVVLEKTNQEENHESKSDRQDQKEKDHIFKLEVQLSYFMQIVVWRNHYTKLFLDYLSEKYIKLLQ